MQSQEISLPLEGMLPEVVPATNLKSGSLPSAKTSDDFFFDDFYYFPGIPDTTKWQNGGVMVNNQYSANPVTLGIATFDALDANGNMRAHDGSLSFRADTLTSKPLNLAGKTNLILHYYIEAGGLGDSPEATDTFKLQIFRPSTNTWKTADSVNGTIAKGFQLRSVNIPAEYAEEGFRFRFFNTVTLTTLPDNPARTGNSDIWNLDYIVLKTKTSGDESVLKDLAFKKLPATLFQDYTTMPWSHYSSILASKLTEHVPVSIISYFPSGSSSSTNVRFYYTDLAKPGNNSGDPDNLNYTSYDLTPNVIDTLDNSSDNLNQFELLASGVTGSPETFSVKLTLEFNNYSDTLDSRPENNLASFTQYLGSEYAYDDGSPESGYGFRPSGSLVSFAMRYEAYKPDMLEGVRLYFCPRAEAPANPEYFKVYAWGCATGTLLPSDSLASAEYSFSSEMDYGWHYFEFKEPVEVNGKFFIGLRQENPKYLHLGLDKNNRNYRSDSTKQNLYINTTGSWETSSFKEAVMIRPVFGSIIDNIPEPALQNTLDIYPVPATDNISLQIPTVYGNTVWQVTITDITGRALINTPYQAGNTIDIQRLTGGIHLLRAIAPSGERMTAKFIVKH